MNRSYSIDFSETLTWKVTTYIIVWDCLGVDELADSVVSVEDKVVVGVVIPRIKL